MEESARVYSPYLYYYREFSKVRDVWIDFLNTQSSNFCGIKYSGGDRRQSRKEFLRFLDIADGSLTEVEACLEIALDLKYITKEQLEELEIKRREIVAMMSGFIKSIKKSL